MTKRELIQEQLIEALYERAELAADYILEASNTELVTLYENILNIFQKKVPPTKEFLKNQMEKIAKRKDILWNTKKQKQYMQLQKKSLKHYGI